MSETPSPNPAIPPMTPNRWVILLILAAITAAATTTSAILDIRAWRAADNALDTLDASSSEGRSAGLEACLDENTFSNAHCRDAYRDR